MGEFNVAETGTMKAVGTRDATRWDRCARLVLAFRPPTEETVRELADWNPGNLVRLQTEYTRLFVNGRGGPVAPAEAVCWFAADGPSAQGDFLSSLLGAYALDGVGMDPTAGLPPDHLAVLLEFLWLLESRDGKAASGGAGAPAAEAFIARFLKPWLPRFLGTLEAAETVSFYRRAARELEDLVLVRA